MRNTTQDRAGHANKYAAAPNRTTSNSGMNLLDTAAMYGTNQVMGKARRDRAPEAPTHARRG